MRLGSSAVTMVGHCRFLLTEEKKAEMEEGGGTKESTKVMRKTIGANFQQYVEEREATAVSSVITKGDGHIFFDSLKNNTYGM